MDAHGTAAARPPQLSLSVLVPVYNEQYVVSTSLSRLKVLGECEFLTRIEIIVVDDGSRDQTPQVLDSFAQALADESSGSPAKVKWIFRRHQRNRGKGEAIRTALALATGDISVVHDADLEYNPSDLVRMMRVFIDEDADAVYGSRFAGGGVRRALFFRHQLGNKLLTFFCNMVSNLNLTDIETCYKAVRTDLLKSIPITSNTFDIEPEITIKLAKRGARVFEIPISYSGRTYHEGKKIGWRDGLIALWAIAKFGVSDEIYAQDEYGSRVLARLSRAPRFNAWMADTIGPYVGQRVLEIGSGTGNLTRRLAPRGRYVASDVNPHYLETLAKLKEGRPYLSAAFCDVSDLSSFPRSTEGYDTVICLNVIEHVGDDHAALRNIKSVLAEHGRAIVLVPQGPSNMGTLDTVLGHRRRYSRESLAQLAADCGLRLHNMIEFNRLGTIAWFLNGRILKRRTFGAIQIWALNILTPLLRKIDRALPIPPLSLIAVLEREDDAQAAPARAVSIEAPQVSVRSQLS
jgi:glycosyltransferase involved in cell wall biosynthesis/phospholipid N-methyltransferase